MYTLSKKKLSIDKKSVTGIQKKNSCYNIEYKLKYVSQKIINLFQMPLHHHCDIALKITGKFLFRRKIGCTFLFDPYLYLDTKRKKKGKKKTTTKPSDT